MGALQTAESRVESVWQSVQGDCEHVVGDVQAAAAQKLKDARSEMITKVLAPWHKQLDDNVKNVGDVNADKVLMDASHDWNAYADDFDSSAKGQWADRARGDIRKQAKGLADIAPQASGMAW